MNQVKHRFFFLLACFVGLHAHAQTDTLVLANAKVLYGKYRVTYNLRAVENKDNPKERYNAEAVVSLHTPKKQYRSSSFAIQGVLVDFMAEQKMDGQVDLYGADFPAGAFNVNSVQQSFYYFEREGKLTYIDHINLASFYEGYFGDCFGRIPKKLFKYNDFSIKKVLAEYNKCLNPNAPQKAEAPVFSSLAIYGYGGIGKLKHYPLEVEFNDGTFRDNAYSYGLGLSGTFRQKSSWGIELVGARHDVASPVFLYPSSNRPLQVDFDFKTIGLGFNWAYNFLFQGFELSPGFEFNISKIYDLHSTRRQQEIFINFPALSTDPDAKVFKFNNPIFGGKAFARIGHGLGEKLGVFAKASFGVDFTKSEVSDEGNHAIDGFQFFFGLFYKIKS